jgi:glucosamine--fructose-6-phosphate aminotransferase (isomerizing)
VRGVAFHMLELQMVVELLAPLFSVFSTQSLTYYACVLLGLDVDKSRDLAKSATVK